MRKKFCCLCSRAAPTAAWPCKARRRLLQAHPEWRDILRVIDEREADLADSTIISICPPIASGRRSTRATPSGRT